MGCCNKTIDGLPISRSRYWFGSIGIGCVLLGLLTWLTLLSPLVPRYRRILPFYREYARDVWSGVRLRDRIRVGPCAGNPDCTFEEHRR